LRLGQIPFPLQQIWFVEPAWLAWVQADIAERCLELDRGLPLRFTVDLSHSSDDAAACIA
jgi:hypothetical protein